MKKNLTPFTHTFITDKQQPRTNTNRPACFYVPTYSGHPPESRRNSHDKHSKVATPIRTNTNLRNKKRRGHARNFAADSVHPREEEEEEDPLARSLINTSSSSYCHSCHYRLQRLLGREIGRFVSSPLSSP